MVFSSKNFLKICVVLFTTFIWIFKEDNFKHIHSSFSFMRALGFPLLPPQKKILYEALDAKNCMYCAISRELPHFQCTFLLYKSYRITISEYYTEPVCTGLCNCMMLAFQSISSQGWYKNCQRNIYCINLPKVILTRDCLMFR